MADLDEGRTDEQGNREFIVGTTGGPKKYFNQRRQRNPLFKTKLELKTPLKATWYLNLTQQLRRARQNKHLTQAQLGKLIGTNQAAISRFELGKMNTTVDFIDRLSKTLNLNITVNFRDS